MFVVGNAFLGACLSSSVSGRWVGGGLREGLKKSDFILNQSLNGQISCWRTDYDNKMNKMLQEMTFILFESMHMRIYLFQVKYLMTRRGHF